MFTTGTFHLKITKNPGTRDVKSFCVQNISSTQKILKKLHDTVVAVVPSGLNTS